MSERYLETRRSIDLRSLLDEAAHLIWESREKMGAPHTYKRVEQDLRAVVAELDARTALVVVGQTDPVMDDDDRQFYAATARLAAKPDPAVGADTDEQECGCDNGLVWDPRVDGNVVPCPKCGQTDEREAAT